MVAKREIPARAYVSMFNFKGPDQQKRIGDLSGGEMNRLHLARTLKRGGNVLLLDEPTNDLDVDTLRALEEAVTSFAGCAVVISHDRWFLDRVATHILAFEGESRTVWFEGNYQEYEADRKRRLGIDADQPHRIKAKKLAERGTQPLSAPSVAARPPASRSSQPTRAGRRPAPPTRGTAGARGEWFTSVPGGRRRLRRFR